MKPSTFLQITRCPRCGSKEIHRVTRNVRREFKGRAYVAQKISFEECRNCGEHLYDGTAMKKLEQARKAVGRAVTPRNPRPKHRVSA